MPSLRFLLVNALLVTVCGLSLAARPAGSAPSKGGSAQTKGKSSSKTKASKKSAPKAVPAPMPPPIKLPDLAELWGRGQLAIVKSRGETRNSLKFYDLRLEEITPPPEPPAEPEASKPAKRLEAVKPIEPVKPPPPMRRYSLAGSSPFKSQGGSAFKMVVTQTPEGVTAVLNGWGLEPIRKEDDEKGRIVFLHPKVQVTLVPVLSEEFKPTKFHAVAYSGASIIKRENIGSGTVAIIPLSKDGVLALAEDELGRCKGVFKFPAWDYSVQLNGVKHQDEFFLESESPGNHIGKWNVTANSSQPDRPGLTGPKAYTNQHLRIRWSAGGLSLSCKEVFGVSFDWGYDLHDQSSVSAEVDAAGLRTLEPLRAEHEKKWDRSLWTRGDDTGSFLETADRAYAKGGLFLNLPITYEGGARGEDHRNGEATGRLLARRAMAAGMKTIPWTVGPKR